MATAIETSAKRPWGKRAVAPDRIVAELDSVWQETADSDRLSHDSDAARVRMTLATMIVLVDLNRHENARDAVSRLISDLCVEYPSRFVIIGCDELSSEALTAEVSSQCVPRQPGSHVCSEEVYFSVNQDGTRAVPNLVRSVLVPDVPVELLVLNPDSITRQPVDRFDHLAASLAGIADRVLFDSAALEHYQPARRDFQSSQLGQNAVRDLSWQRVQRWCRIIAEQFDLSECTDPLSSINKVVISGSYENSADGPQGSISDLLWLGAWTASKLKWEIAGAARMPDGWAFDASSPQQNSLCSLLLLHEGGKAAHLYGQNSEVLSSVSFHAAHSEGGELQIQVEYLPDAAMVQVIMESGASKSGSFCGWNARKVPLEALGLAELVFAEVSAGAVCHELGEVEQSVESLVNALNAG